MFGFIGAIPGTSYYKYFINVYQEGFNADEYEMGIWRSTFYDDTDNNIKETNHWKSEIAIANVDGDSPNEVVLLTAHYLAIFRYDAGMPYAYNGEEGAFQRIAELNVADSVGETSLLMRSLTCGNIDDDDEDEILIAATVPGAGVYQSYILVYDYDRGLDSGLHLKFSIPIDDARIGHQSLRIADLDGDGIIELCSTAYTEDQNGYQSYVYIWEHTEGGWFNTRHDIEIGSETDPPWNHLDTGELLGSSGDEIVLSIGHLGQLILCECVRISEGGDFQLNLGPRANSTFINGVSIADADGMTGNEIVVYGGNLEVYTSDLMTLIWKRIERPDDGEIWYVGIR